jgi:hypothetical protein
VQRKFNNPEGGPKAIKFNQLKSQKRAKKKKKVNIHQRPHHLRRQMMKERVVQLISYSLNISINYYHNR